MFETGRLKTAKEDWEVTLIGHGPLRFSFGAPVIPMDPVGNPGDYKGLPTADVIVMTQDHPDPLDGRTVERLYPCHQDERGISGLIDLAEDHGKIDVRIGYLQ